MEPTVLAGPVEFSPAEIALILAVLALAALVLSAPGWAVLGYVMGRRPGPHAPAGRRWAARVGGALLGMAVSAAVLILLVGLLDRFSFAVPVALVGAWTACWAMAYVLRPRSAPEPPRAAEGWGR